MKCKFYVGAYAGCIGHTENGYPIRDHFIVNLVTENGAERFFQLREKFGVIVNNEWQEIIPERETRMSSDDVVYDRPVWKVDGMEVFPEELIRQYDIVEITDLLEAIQAYKSRLGERKTPYFDSTCILEMPEMASKRKLDRRREADKGIIRAMDDYLESEKTK